MPISHRFGKRIPLPSTRQIRHEILVMWAQDEARKSAANAEASAKAVVPTPSIGP
jgi:hypothetical protein